MNKHNPAYVEARRDVVRLVPTDCRRILDIGCATGRTGELLKKTRAGLSVVGVELDAGMAELASAHLDEVYVGEISELMSAGAIAGERFDCILLADILEHLVDPWALVRQLAKHLEPDGTIVTSLPNVRHFSTLLSLIFAKRWPYRDRGIHDRTHLRFFAQRNLDDLFDGTGLTMTGVGRNFRLIEAPHPVNRFAWIFGFPPLRDLVTFQYLIVAKMDK